MQMTEIPELATMWKEKQENENPPEETDELFVPAKLAEKDGSKPLIHIDL